MERISQNWIYCCSIVLRMSIPKDMGIKNKRLQAIMNCSEQLPALLVEVLSAYNHYELYVWWIIRFLGLQNHRLYI